MKTITVIPARQLPARLPLFPSLTIWLVLDRLDVPALWRGVAYTLIGAWWVVAITAFVMQRSRSVWPEDDAEATPTVRPMRGGNRA